MINNYFNKIITPNSRILFVVLLGILFLDRTFTLVHFGFIYTDFDQTILWNGAIDYSRGIFHEPFFYGQAYNYMLESLLAVPLIWIGIPVNIALPIITSLVALFPFVFLSVFLKRKKNYFWSSLSLIIPIILPLEYSMLTCLPRGFIQAHLFIPFLFIPLLNPSNKRNISLFFIFSGLSFIMNQSSILLILPLTIYLFLFHYKSFSFYLKSLLFFPFLIINYLATYYYTLNPEKIMHGMEGIHIDTKMFLSTVSNTNLFEFLFPFFSGLGFFYPILFLILGIFALTKRNKKKSLFILSFFLFLVITLSIPKVHWIYEKGGIFFSSSRFYTLLPLFLFVQLFMIFRNKQITKHWTFLILTVSISIFLFKNIGLDEKVDRITQNSIFPKSKVDELQKRINEVEKISKENNCNLIISQNGMWHYAFDGYCFYPLTKNKNIRMVNLHGDRRSWLYSDSEIHEKVLLHGFEVNDTLFEPFDFKIINDNHIILRNNTMNNKELTNYLNIE